jgi:hypothetical protein
MCRCVCGKELIVKASLLGAGQRKSCGCKAFEDNKGKGNGRYRHGHKTQAFKRNESNTYKAWDDLRRRFDTPPEWNDFNTFLAEVGDRPDSGFYLTRRDNRKPHSKANTYWKDPYERDELEPEPTLNLRGLGSKARTAGDRPA